MKKLLLFFFLLIFFLAAVSYINSNPGVIISGLDIKNYDRAEELRYRVYLFGFLPVGEATLKSEKEADFNGKKALCLAASAESSKLFSRFFHSTAVIDTYVDPISLNPVYFKQRISVSGKEDSEKEVFYDQEKNIMTTGGVKRKISANTLEPLTVFLNLRRMDFDIHKKFEMHLNTNQKDYLLEGKAETKVLKSGGAGFNIVSVKINIRRSDKNNPYHRSNLDMVFVDGEENIPILIKVFASGFYISAKLIDIR